MDKESIIRKIKSLLELAANDPESNESKIAGKKAGQLMAQYNIKYIEEDTKNDNKVVKVTSTVYMERNIVWEHALITTIAEVFDCKAIKTTITFGAKQKRFSFNIIGFAADTDLCQWYFKYLRTIISKHGEDKFRKIKERKSYQMGMVASIGKRLREIMVEREKHTDASTKDLVLTKKYDVQKAYEQMYPKVKKATNRSKIDYDSYAKGVNDGQKISLSRPIAKGTEKEQKINGKLAIG